MIVSVSDHISILLTVIMKSAAEEHTKKLSSKERNWYHGSNFLFTESRNLEYASLGRDLLVGQRYKVRR